MKKNVFIVVSFAAILVIIAGLSFAASYNALDDLAAHHGMGKLSFVLPCIIDGSVVAFIMANLYYSLNGQKGWWFELAMIATFTVISVTLNVVHANDHTLDRFIASLPPIALFLVTKAFERFLHFNFERFHLVATVTALDERVEKKRSQLASLEEQMNTKHSQLASLDEKMSAHKAAIEALNEQLEALKKEQMTLKTDVHSANEHPNEQSEAQRMAFLDDANMSRQEAMEARRAALASYVNTDVPQSDLAEMFGVSQSTIRRDMAALEASNGRHSDNGRVS